MTKNSLLLALVLGLTMACGDDSSSSQNPDDDVNVVRSEKQRITAPDVPAEQLAELVAGNTQFSLDLLREIRKTDEGNVIYSPHSISLALAMTYAGARTHTEAEMASALNFMLPQSELHPAFNALDLKLSSRGKNAQGSDGQPFRLNIANALWLQDGADFEISFLDTLALNYGAGVSLIDFDADPEAARLVINRWVENKTEDKIKDLLPENSITTDTVAVLTNAIYFNAAWREQFEDSATADRAFHAPTGDIMVSTMAQLASLGYAQETGFEAIELPYDGDEVSMVILLPDPTSDLSTLEANLDGPTLHAVMADLEPELVDLTLPKFTFTTPTNLNQILRDLGMPSAFDNADFSGMSATMSLAISDVVHKAFIAINEKGTEAAAATAVIVGETSAPVADTVVHVDRPFLFVIRDRETNAVIFMGRVVDPSK